MLIHSGQVFYKMEVEKPIPEFIDFKIFKFPINIYKGQPKSCHYCFEIGHVASNCQIKLENQKKRNDDNEINSVTVEREKNEQNAATQELIVQEMQELPQSNS